MNRFFQDTAQKPSHETKLGHKLVESVKVASLFGFASLQLWYLDHLLQSGAPLHFRDDLPFRTAVKENRTENALFLLNYPNARPVNVMANNASAFLNAAKNDNPILVGEVGVRAGAHLTPAMVYEAAEAAVDGNCCASAGKLIEDFNLSAEQVGVLRDRAAFAANDAMVKTIDKAVYARKRQQIETAPPCPVQRNDVSVQPTPEPAKAACYLGAA